MHPSQPRPISGHVFKRKGKRGSVWYAKYRLAGRQAAAETTRAGLDAEDRRRPMATSRRQGPGAPGRAAGDRPRQGTLPGLVQTGKTFRDAADEWLAYCENVRDCKPSTMRDYRNMVRVLDREFGDRKIESITSEEIELWVSGHGGSNRTRQKYVVCLGSIFKRAMKLYGLPRNPVDIVERPRVRRAAKIDVLRPEEVLALVRAARRGAIDRRRVSTSGRGLAALRRQDEMDAAIFHTAAFAGLRMGEILALRWRDIDFSRRTIHVRENWTQGETTTPKSGTERAVPMAEEVAKRLARIGQREHFTADERPRLLHDRRPAPRLQVPEGPLPRRAARQRACARTSASTTSATPSAAP